jgi:hypothetical protein
MAKSQSTAKTPKAASKSADPHRAKLDELAASLAPGAVSKAPTHAKKRAEHLIDVAAAAASDAEMLLKVPLDDGRLEAWELAVFPLAARVVKELGDSVGADRLKAGVTLAPADALLLATARTDQKLLLSAFRRLRFKGDTAKLDELRRIEAGDPADVIDARDDSSALIALADHDTHRAWVATLPLGEADAVVRLKAAQPRLEALAKAAQGDKAAAALRESYRRIWTVLVRIDRRVRTAADYLFHGKARMAEYRAFKAPARAKKKPATK